MESIYYAFLCLEARVRKHDLSLGFIDNDHHISNIVLEHLYRHFPQKLFTRTETYDTYVFSYKGDLPAKPILELRKKFYSAYDISNNDLEEYRERELSKALSKADVKTMVSFCQSFYTNVSGSYDFFKWCKVEKYYSTGLPNLKRHVEMDCSGIILYLSDEHFETELSGTVPLLKAPLLKLIGNTPLSRLLSFEIYDIKEDY